MRLIDIDDFISRYCNKCESRDVLCESGEMCKMFRDLVHAPSVDTGTDARGFIDAYQFINEYCAWCDVRDEECDNGPQCDIMVSLAKYANAKSNDILRCKDCIHWIEIDAQMSENKIRMCNLAKWLVGERGYCLYGERKEIE